MERLQITLIRATKSQRYALPSKPMSFKWVWMYFEHAYYHHFSDFPSSVRQQRGGQREKPESIKPLPRMEVHLVRCHEHFMRGTFSILCRGEVQMKQKAEW